MRKTELYKTIEKNLKKNFKHENKEIEFILNKGNEVIAYAKEEFGLDEYIIKITTTDLVHFYLEEIDEMDYDYVNILFKKLNEGFEINYMTIKAHYWTWIYISELYDLDNITSESAMKYLAFCSRNGICQARIRGERYVFMDVPNIVSIFVEEGII